MGPRAVWLSAVAGALTLSLIVPTSALAQVGRDLTMGERAFGALTYVIAWALGTAVLLALTAILAWVVPADQAERIYTSTRRAPARAVGFGLLAAIGLPLTVIALAVTILGIPLAIATAILAIPLGAAGYVTSGWLIGRALSERGGGIRDARSRVAWAVIGVGILRLVALVPFVDVLMLGAACAVGVGALFATYDTVTQRRTQAPRRAPPGERVTLPGMTAPSAAGA